MCRFHNEIAAEVATDKATGKIDLDMYAVTLTALAKYWVERYIPEMGETDGEFKYELATQRAQDALARSGLETNVDTILQYRYTHIDEVRAGVRAIATQFNIVQPEHPYKRTKFLDDAYLHVFEGNPAGDYRVTSKPSADPRYETLRQSTAALLAIPDMDKHLETMITGKMAEIFIEARHTARPFLLRAYEALPTRLQDQFRSCASCAGGTAGGVAAGHVGCVAAMGSGFIPVAGAAGSVATMGMSAAFTAAVVGGWYYLRGRFAEPLQQKIVIGSAVIGTALAGGWHLYNTDTHGHDTDSHTTMTPETQQRVATWLSQQSPENLLIIMQQANTRKMSLESYAATICGEDRKTMKNQPLAAAP